MVVRDEFRAGDVLADGLGGSGEVFLFALKLEGFFAGCLRRCLGEVVDDGDEVGKELPAGGLEDEDGHNFWDLHGLVLKEERR